MYITDLIPGTALTIDKARPGLLENLKSGQLLQARVISTEGKTSLILRVGNTDVAAKADISVRPGEKLQLQVLRVSNPLELLVLGRARKEDAQIRAMRSALPRQHPVSRLLNHLSGSAPKTGSSAVPPAEAGIRLFPAGSAGAVVRGDIQNAILKISPGTSDKILQQVTRILGNAHSGAEPLTAARIKQAFLDSGLFLESNLASGNAVGTDLKASLVRLLFQLRPLLQPPQSGGRQIDRHAHADQQPANPLPANIGRMLLELLAQTEGALSRTLLHQLASLPREDTTQQVWQFELPIRHQEGTHDLFVRLSREYKSGEDKGEPRWSVRLEFNFPNMGPVATRLTLQDDIISSHFTAQHLESAQKLDRAMPVLTQAFLRAGLKPGPMTACQGDVIREDQPARSPKPLLDEKA